MEISSTMQMQVVLYATPRRLADETGGNRYKLPEPEAGSGPARYVAYVFVFLGIAICWLYKLTLSDQANVTAAES
jgi:hypothetical protein